MQGLLFILAAAVLILLLPVILPVVAVLDVLGRRRKVRDAERFACVRCGEILGRSGLELGDAAWREHFAALARAHPGVKLRIVRDVDAACSRCGSRYGHDERTRTFRLLPTPPPL